MEEEMRVSKLSEILDSDETIDLFVSYSKLSDFDRNGPSCLIHKSSGGKEAVKLGSLVDDLLFLDKSLFDEKYYLFDGDKPSATLGLLCDIIVNNYMEIPQTEDIVNIGVANSFWTNIKKPELYLAKFNVPEFWDYLNTMFKVNNRTIITSSELSIASDLAEILRTHQYSKYILDNEFDNYYQVKFQYDYKGFKVRGIIDIITVDHKSKKVVMTDLKTGKGPSTEFEESFVKWRYYFQSAIYVKAFQEICDALDLKDYTLEPFQFLYISRSDKTPLLFKTTDKWINAAWKGFRISKYTYKGIDEILDEIYWCWKNKEYNIPKRVAEANGVVELKDNFIEVD
jgi:hypothetical protein